MKPQVIKACPTCGYVGAATNQKMDGVQVALLIFLLLTFLIPGIIYAIVLDSGKRRCPKCRKSGMVPVNGPIGRTLADKASVDAGQRFASRAEYLRWRSTQRGRHAWEKRDSFGQQTRKAY